MNMSEYLSMCNNLEYNESDTEIHIIENNFILPVWKGELVIDKTMYCNGFLAFNPYCNLTVNLPINIHRRVRITYDKLIPGSFIGEEIQDYQNPCMDYLLINGYVVKNGVLS